MYPKYMHLGNYGMLKSCRYMVWLGKVVGAESDSGGRQAAVHSVSLLQALNH